VDGLKEKLAAATSRRNGSHHPSKPKGLGGATTRSGARALSCSQPSSVLLSPTEP